MSVEDQKQNTFNTIMNRCRNLIPPVDLNKHIKYETLEIKPLVLDGINFECHDPEALEAEFGGRMLPKADAPKINASTFVPALDSLKFDTSRGPRSENASMISMKEDPDHWALKASFGATIGTGFREQWQPPPSIGVQLPRLAEPKYGKTDPFALGFGEQGYYLKFTALHAAVAPPPLQTKKRGCNVHIDERGFVVKLPDGAVVSPTSWSHIANELLVKTKLRDWLDGKIGDNMVGKYVVEVVNRLNVRFSDAENGFAGASSRINGMSGVKDAYKAFMPIGLSYDMFKFNHSTIQANYYSYDGQKTLTLTWGGTFDAGGSK